MLIRDLFEKHLRDLASDWDGTYRQELKALAKICNIFYSSMHLESCIHFLFFGNDYRLKIRLIMI